MDALQQYASLTADREKREAIAKMRRDAQRLKQGATTTSTLSSATTTSGSTTRAATGMTEQPAPGGEAAGAALGGAKTVAKNVVSIPRQAIGGLIDAVNETADLPADIFETFGLDEAAEDYRARVTSGGIPTTGESSTTTGKITRPLVQFFAPFAIARKAKMVKAVAEKGGRIAADAVATIAADFLAMDPGDTAVQAFFDAYPDTEIPLLDYLKSSEEDPAIIRRAKGALGEAGLGMVADGALTLFKAHKYAKMAKRDGITSKDVADAVEGAKKQVEDAIPDVGDAKLEILGTKTGPALVKADGKSALSRRLMKLYGLDVTKVEPGDVVRAAKGKGEISETEIEFINFRRLDNPDEINRVIRKLADEDADAILEAKGGGPRSHAQVVREAKSNLGELLGRPVGEMLTDRQVIGATRLLNAATRGVYMLAEMSLATGKASDMYAFKHAVAVQNAIQERLIVSGTETARALAARRIPVGTDAAAARAIANAIDNSDVDLKTLAKQLLELRSNPAAASALIRKGPSFGGMWQEFFLNGMLWSPKTWAINALSNSGVALWAIPEHYTAAALGELNPRLAGIEVSEVNSMAFGMVKGARRFLEVFGKTWKEGLDPGDLAKIETPHVPQITTQNLNDMLGLDVKPESMLGRTIDFLAETHRTTGRILGSTDAAFKHVAREMHSHATAARMATEKGLEGEAWGKFVAEVLHDPPPELLKGADDFAGVQTFTARLTGPASKIQEFGSMVPASKLVLPFVRTPINIFKFTMRRTPLGLLSKSVRADIKAGGPRAAKAYAQMGLGTMVMMYGMDLVAEGRMVGGSVNDHTRRDLLYAQGKEPYSIELTNGMRVSLARFEPFGMWLGLGADIAEIGGDLEEGDLIKATSLGAIAIGKNAASKTWLRSMFDAADIIRDTERALPNLAKDVLFRSTVPFSSLIRNVGQVVDPTLRETRALPDPKVKQFVKDAGLGVFGGAFGPMLINDPIATEIASFLVEASEKSGVMASRLPPRHDITGKPIVRGEGVPLWARFVSPIYFTKDKTNPVMQAMEKNKVHLPRLERTLTRQRGGMTASVPLTDSEFSRMEELTNTAAWEEFQAIYADHKKGGVRQGPGSEGAFEYELAYTWAKEDARMQIADEFPRIDAEFERRFDQLEGLR